MLKRIIGLRHEGDIHHIDVALLIDRDLLFGRLVKDVTLAAVTIEDDKVAHIGNLCS